MYKKLLCITLLCICCISSLSFASTADLNLSIYLGESINLKTFLENESIIIPLNEQFNVQNANSQILNVDNSFNINALSVGETILAIVNEETIITVKVRVKSPIKDINLAEDDLTLLAGEIYPLNYNIIPQEDYLKSFNKQLRWTSSRPNIVGIKGNNTIYTYAIGTTILTGTTFDGSLSILVTIKVIPNPSALTIKPDVLKSFVNVGEIRQLKAFFGTKDVTTNIKWESQYPELLTIDDDGIVMPLRAGTCEITAQSSIDRKKDTYTFFIKSMVDKVTLDRRSIVLEVAGSQEKLNAILTYNDPAVTPLLDGFYYQSSNTSIVTVTPDGLLTAQGPGIALVSAIAYDSGKKDSCTVEVIGEAPPTSIDYTLVRELHLTPYTNDVLIGEKILLDYDIYPSNATDQSVRFDIRNGSINQIKYINGQYYFIPDKRGTYKIKIVSNGGVEDISDTIDVRVKSPIASLNLELSIDRETNNNKKLYVGERVEVLTEILTQGHYNTFDVYPSTLEYSVIDPDILDLTYLNGKYYITALKRGSTSVIVKNKEERHEKTLSISVVSPVSKLSTDREVRLPINIYYAPSVYYVPTNSAKEITDLHLEEGINLKVEAFYFKESYIDNEIAYEKQIINIFKTIPYTPTSNSTIERHNTRLKRLQGIKFTASNGYCLVTNAFLKDRDFINYKYYEIKDNQISGNYLGKAKISVSIDGSATNAKTMIYWQDDQNDFSIKSSTNWVSSIDILKREGYGDSLSTLSQEELVKYAVYYSTHKQSFKSKPSIEVLAALINLDKTQLPKFLTTDMDALTTLDELAYLSMYLDKRYTNHMPLKTNNIYYYDVIKDSVKQSLARGYIIPLSENYLRAANNIEYDTFKSMVDKVYPENTLPVTIDSPLTHKQIILLLNQL